MRKDTSFSERKLTTEEFTEKYWLDGLSPYQYHTASIEDGRDEREQFLFNNIRALFDMIKWHRDRHTDWKESHKESLDRRFKKITALAATSTVIGTVGLVLAILAYLK